MNTEIERPQTALVPNGTALPQAERVPNGTTTPNLRSLVERYKLQAISVGEHFTKLADIVVEAKEELPPKQFEQFCKEVRLDTTSATYRKMLTIGRNASRFEPYLDLIPPSWTTRYKLATLTEDKFKQVVEDPSFNINSTAKDIHRILNGPAPEKPKSRAETITIDLVGIADEQRRQLCQQLLNLVVEFGVQVEPSKAVGPLFDDLRRAA